MCSLKAHPQAILCCGQLWRAGRSTNLSTAGERWEGSLQTPWGLLALSVFAPSCTEGLFLSVWAHPALLCVQPPLVLPPVQVQELFPSASRTQLRDACTASSYILTLLLQGYKFNYTTWPNIHFVQQVGECPAASTLCAMECFVPTLLLLGMGDPGQHSPTAHAQGSP